MVVENSQNCIENIYETKFFLIRSFTIFFSSINPTDIVMPRLNIIVVGTVLGFDQTETFQRHMDYVEIDFL